MITLKTSRELSFMRDAGRIAGEALRLVGEAVKPGVTTEALDRIACAYIRRCGAQPTFLGYNGFPAGACISVNHEVIHGIPSHRRVLREGDLVSVDLGATWRGYVGDTAATFAVGKISAQAQALCDATREALYAAISLAVPGGHVGDISAAVQQYCETRGYSLVRDFSGHGVGRALHEDPSVPNVGIAGRGVGLRAGMTIAIEPMVNAGKAHVRVLPDHWTVVTKDSSLSAHFEHTVAVTADGPVILTRAEE